MCYNIKKYFQKDFLKMSNQDKDLTVGQLCGIIKKSFRRSLIYILITVVCLSAILFTVKGFTDTKVFSTTLVFSDVKESPLSGLNANKAFVLDRATSDKNNPSLSSLLLPDLSVSAEVPEGEAASFISNTYVISLKHNKKTGLTSNEYKNIVDNVANEYVRSFSATLQTLPFNYYESELASSEYIHHILNLSETIEEYIKILETELASFDNLSSFTYENKSGEKKGVTNFLSELTVTKSTLSRLTQTVITNKIEKTEGGLVSYLTYARDTANAKVARLSESLKESELVLEKYKNVSQIVQPYQFGDNWTKQTCLWLKNLPPLIPLCYAPYGKTRNCAPSWVYHKCGSKARSKSFTGIARAMATQWQFD